MAEIEELRAMASAVLSKKGRMDAKEREQASQLVASVLTNESLDLSEILPSFEVFQSEAIGHAIGRVWPTLSGNRRDLFSRWIPEPKSEKATRRIAILAAAVLEVDGVASLGWLSRLISNNPKARMSREISQAIASAFFGAKSIRFVRLGDSGNRQELLIGVLKALVDIATDDHYSIERMARYRLIEDILTIISQKGLGGNEESNPILARIDTEIRRWPHTLIEQIVGTLKRKIPDAEPLLSNLLPEFISSAPNPILHAPVAQQHSEEQIHTVTEKTQVKSTLEQHIASLASQLEELRALSKLLIEEERLKKELERQLQEKETKESSLQAQMKQISHELADTATRLKSASNRIEELERANKIAEESMELERQRLTQQITANASGRVEEFKNNLALVLSRLIRDLPARDTQLTADVGNIVFLQFHQFLDMLDGQGVKIRKGKGAI